MRKKYNILFRVKLINNRFLLVNLCIKYMVGTIMLLTYIDYSIYTYNIVANIKDATLRIDTRCSMYPQRKIFKQYVMLLIRIANLIYCYNLMK